MRALLCVLLMVETSAKGIKKKNVFVVRVVTKARKIIMKKKKKKSKNDKREKNEQNFKLCDMLSVDNYESTNERTMRQTQCTTNNKTFPNLYCSNCQNQTIATFNFFHLLLFCFVVSCLSSHDASHLPELPKRKAKKICHSFFVVAALCLYELRRLQVTESCT